MADLKPTVIGVGILMPILAIAAVALRIQARRVKRLSLGMDDYVIIIGMVFSVGICINLLICAFVGNLGGHVHYDADGTPVDSDSLRIYSETLWVGNYISILGFGFTKLGVLLFYKRIFVVGKTFQVISWTMMGIVVAWTVAFFFANLFDCWPISINFIYNNGQTEAAEQCVDFAALIVSSCVTDILTDAIILVLPWYQVWKLQMPLRRKLAVCGIFVLGGFVVAAGIIRFVYVMDSSFAEAMNPDVTYVTAPAIYWTCVEGCLGVVSACLPVMRPLLSEQYYGNILRSLRSSVRGSKHSSNQSSKDSYNKRRVIWPRRNGGDTSDSSLVGQKHGPACNYTIGGTPMDDIPNPSRNIMIETKIDQGFDIV